MPHNEGRPHGQPVYTPLKSFEEIFKEKREREMREAGHRPPAGAVAGFYGRDHLGRIRFSERLPWVRSGGSGVIRLDVGLAASQGIQITRDPSGYVRVRA